MLLFYYVKKLFFSATEYLVINVYFIDLANKVNNIDWLLLLSEF